jgi:hypothetical protein
VGGGVTRPRLALPDVHAVSGVAGLPGNLLARTKTDKAPVCEWRYDSDDTEGDSWYTACGERFVFTCDGPKEHGMAFCCHCGKPLKVKA